MNEHGTDRIAASAAGQRPALEAAPHVLLVDDQPARLLTYESILEGVGVHCVRALSGREALDRLLHQSFAVIVLDVSMPGMDGFETARLIREHPRFERTPIIFVTGVHVSELDTLKGYEVGAIDYISVPVVPEILRSKVALLVELYRRRAELEALNKELEVTRDKLELERRRSLESSEAQLRVSEQRYRAIFELPTQNVVVLEAVRDPTGLIVDWRYRDANNNVLTLLQRSKDQVVDRHLSEVVPERATWLTPLLAKVLQDGQPHRYETRINGVDFLSYLCPIAENTVVSCGVDISARIRAEQEAKQLSEIDRSEKEWLGAVLNSMTEEVYFVDRQLRYTYANPAALLEFGHETVDGVEVAKVVAGLEVFRADGTPRPLEEAPPLRALRGEVVRGEEHIVRTPRTGELRHRQVNSAPVRDRSGKIIGSVSVVRDITEQRRTDAVLRQQEARARALLRLADTFRSLTEPSEIAAAATWLLGETLQVERCGYGTVDAGGEVLSIESEWLAAHSSSTRGVFHFRDFGAFLDEMKRGEAVICADVGSDPRTCMSVAAFDAIAVRSFINAPILERGRFVALMYVSAPAARVWTPADAQFVHEVAERTRVAVERRRSEQAMAIDLAHTTRLRELAARLVAEGNVNVLLEDVLAAAIAISQADAGTVQLLDDASRELRFAAKRGLDAALTSQFERVDARCHSSCGLALARGERVWLDFEAPEIDDTDGSAALHVAYGLKSAVSTPLVSRAGVAVGMLTVHWRSRRRLGERELHFLDLLARQAADLIERTRAEEAVRQSEQQLREADRRKDEFIAVLAHELRNPLVPIRTGVELLKLAAEQPTIVDTVRPMMTRQVAHMVRMIDDLLDVSRITSGKIELRREAVTLSSLVGSAIESNRAAIAGGQLDLRVNLAEPYRMLHVDPTRLSQVISNLLQNAGKFTPAGGSITLEAAIVGKSGQVPVLEITVADSGVGISAAMLPRVFDLFAQDTQGSRHGQNGLGIGLALARRLVEMHGGSIEASSAGAGQGSVFTIRIPAPLAETANSEAGLNPAGSLAGLKLLIVDDNQDAADVMALLATDMGAQVEVAYDGLSGLAALGRRLASVVLLDIGLPDLDGYEVCRRIRAQWGSTVALIALSGWGQEDDKRKATRAGFDAHLTKPADPALLEKTIRALRERFVNPHS